MTLANDSLSLTRRILGESTTEPVDEFDQLDLGTAVKVFANAMKATLLKDPDLTLYVIPSIPDLMSFKDKKTVVKNAIAELETIKQKNKKHAAGATRLLKIIKQSILPALKHPSMRESLDEAKDPSASRNETWGYYGTLNTYFSHQEVQRIWDATVAAFVKAAKVEPVVARRVLDSKWGRWLADRVNEENLDWHADPDKPRKSIPIPKVAKNAAALVTKWVKTKHSGFSVYLKHAIEHPEQYDEAVEEADYSAAITKARKEVNAAAKALQKEVRYLEGQNLGYLDLREVMRDVDSAVKALRAAVNNYKKVDK